MKHKLLLAFAAATLIFAGCAKNELTEQPQPRVMHFTATVEEPAGVRATLEDNEGTIRFRWQTTDIIQMAFVQSEVKKKANAAVTSVSADGRTAQFTVTIPEGITDNDFTLYAYRSSRKEAFVKGSVLLASDPAIAVLPELAFYYLAGLEEEQSYIVSVWCKKEITYSGGDMPAVSLAFQHLGAMLTMKVKNHAAAEVNDIDRIILKGTSNWVRNENGGMAQFDMATESYVAGETMDHTELILDTRMDAPGRGIAPGDEKTYYRWFVPGPYTENNAIVLEARNGYEFIGAAGLNGTKNQIDFQSGKNYRIAVGITSGSDPYKYALNFVPWE